MPGMEKGMEYLTIDTFGAPGGGMMKKMRPDHQITNYIGVPSVMNTQRRSRSWAAGHRTKDGCSGYGLFRCLMDTENNVFGIWESDPKAK